MNRRLALVFTAACGTSTPGGSAHLEPIGVVDPTTTDQAGRSLKRMDLDQLEASLTAVTGEQWTERVDGRTIALFERLSGSLGKPDYLSSTEEDLAPGLLFQKFLDDAAQQLCRALVDADTTRRAGERKLLRQSEPGRDPGADPSALAADVSAALLAWHGRVVAPDDEVLEPWTWLVTTVHDDTRDPDLAWRALCVALTTHPDFTAY